MNIKIGHGYDVHRFAENRKLILGGVEIEYEKGLLGHSDADVLVHALMDAILGALGKGDIGKHFPDTDEKYRGADSMKLLEKVCEIMRDEGYSLSNADCTVIAQAPKLAPHIQKMRENIATVIGCDVSNINVKATTEEKLGFTGEKLGIAAHAVCLLERV
jgi:2-C-methyl-D-erythritol 2,4-cyclodiphosphate synthase